MGSPRVASSAPAREVSAYKLFAPPVYKGAIARDALLNRIFARNGARVVLFQGPAGHGKTTLMQQAKSACDARGFVTGWLSFDDADNDMRRLSLHLQALLASVADTAARVPEDDDVQDLQRRRRSDWVINHLLRLGRPVALFFDEFQSLTNKPVLTFFRDLLDRVPENAMIVIGSRSTPEVGLARLVVNNQALIFSADDLRFSPDEVAQFFSEARELGVSQDEVSAIYKQTEGWPAALQLFRLTLSSPSVRRSLGDIGTYRPRELAEYLADNVLTLQPPRVQEFLLRTSLLTRLSAPLCDAVMGWHGSQDTLLQLERSGLFLRSLDSELHWFKYHTLFSSCLSEQLRNVSEDSVAEVHHRAAEWYHEKGLYEEAIYHAIEVGDYGFATDILDIWSSRLIADGHLTTVERWSDYLPLSEVRKRPSLMIKIAWALIFLRRQQKLRPILEVLEQKAATGDVCKTTNPDVILSMAAVMWDDLPNAFAIVDRVKIFEYQPEGFAAFELGAAANLTGFRELAAGNFEKARECLALARAFSERASASLSGGYSVGVAGENLIVQGQLGVALERFRAGMQEQRPYLDKSFSSASMVACYIRALYEANELDEAEALFGQFHESIADSVLLDFLAVAYIAMARVHDARGRAAKALEVLDEAENIGHTNKWPRLIRIVNWERVRRALLRDEIDRAESIAERIPRDADCATPSDRILFSEDTEGNVIGTIRLALHKGKADDALRLIADELALAVAQGRVQRQIKLHILEALAQRKKGVDNAAHRCLRRAIQLAQPGRFIRTFIDEGDEVGSLLAEEHQSLARGSKVQPTPQELTGFLHALLQAAGLDPGKSAESGDAQPLEPLTDRERQILIFLANGVSNKEMATRIFLSENTVKFHLKNIYSKLAVSSRLQAINAARQMGII